MCMGGEPVSEGYCWGIFREQAHSPGRETDDSEILRLTGKHLEARGFRVVVQSPEEVTWPLTERPRGVFFMCERLEILGHLRELAARGVPHVNAPEAVLNTYRDRMIALLEEAGVEFVESRLVATAGVDVTPGALPVWVKRGDVHNTQEGDVTFATTADAVQAALAGLAARGITQAVLQPHVEGDLVKFYGIGGNARPTARRLGSGPSTTRTRRCAATPSIRSSWAGRCAGRRPRWGWKCTAATPSPPGPDAWCCST